VKVRFLGTGTSQGVPVIACTCEVCTSPDFRNKRLRSSVLIETGGTEIVIDTGPDFRQQMLRNNQTTLDAVLFTHAHRDHTAGLDDIRAFNHKTDTDMPVYAEKNVLEQLKLEFHYIFAENKYPGIPRIFPHIIDTEPFFINTIKVIPIRVLHYKLPVLGFRISNFCYITDAKTITDTEIEKIKGTEILVINALQRDAHISHFTLDEAIVFAQKIGAKHTYFTHISHKLGTHEAVSQLLPPSISLAYDDLEVVMDL
jgi:phosphoribosyl 1,2-cyclic phosphate phosphodiesterase